MAMLALVLDTGRPDRFWKALVYWNTHSLLWEVTIAIMLSAIVGGISLTLFVSMLASRLTPKAKVNDALIERVSRFVG